MNTLVASMDCYHSPHIPMTKASRTRGPLSNSTVNHTSIGRGGMFLSRAPNKAGGSSGEFLPALLMTRQLRGYESVLVNASNSDRFHEVDLGRSGDFVVASQHYRLFLDTESTLSSPSKSAQYDHQVGVAVPRARHQERWSAES